MFGIRGARDRGVRSWDAEREAQSNFGSAITLQEIVAELPQALPVSLVVGITDGIGTLRTFPKVVSQRALGNHSHTFLGGKGQYRVDTVLVGYVYGDLDSLKLAGLNGVERGRPIAAIPNEADLSGFAGSMQYA